MNNLNYNFSFDEVKELVVILRNSEIPLKLNKFKTTLENKIYEHMSIQEAEEFFNEE